MSSSASSRPSLIRLVAWVLMAPFLLLGGVLALVAGGGLLAVAFQLAASFAKSLN